MARNNAKLNAWIVDELAGRVDSPVRSIVEVGSGPGVGTERLLSTFPDASVIAVDPSHRMQQQLRRRNSAGVSSGRLRTVTGDLASIEEVHDADIVTAVHVLYFWRDPANEIQHTYRLLRPSGMVALGYQLARDMPAAAQRDFPATGHRLVEDDSEVEALVLEAGFASASISILGTASHPAGRLLLATRS